MHVALSMISDACICRKVLRLNATAVNHLMLLLEGASISTIAVAMSARRQAVRAKVLSYEPLHTSDAPSHFILKVPNHVQGSICRKVPLVPETVQDLFRSLLNLQVRALLLCDAVAVDPVATQAGIISQINIACYHLKLYMYKQLPSCSACWHGSVACLVQAAGSIECMYGMHSKHKRQR